MIERTLEPERKLYPAAKRWLVQAGCYAAGVNTGVTSARIDAIGIRDVGGELASRTEVIAIEVKRNRSPFGNAIGQAHGYSVYADRCYLADVRPSRTPFTPEEKRIASHLRVGLLAITRDAQGRLRIREVQTAPLGEPLPELRLEIIEKLGYAECTICHSFFKQRAARPSDIGRNVVRSGKRTGALTRAVHDEKGFVYWLSESDARSGNERALYYHRRYVCPDCVWNLFRDFTE